MSEHQLRVAAEQLDFEELSLVAEAEGLLYEALLKVTGEERPA